MNKKGMFFTLLAIVLISLFLLTFSFYSKIDERRSVEKRIKTMDSFVFSLEEDIKRQIYISTFRALLSLEQYMTETGNYLDFVHVRLREALLNGTVYEQNVSLMEGYTLNSWNTRINELAETVNAEVNYSLGDVTFEQHGPWIFNVKAEIVLFVRDKGGLAEWNRSETIFVPFSIEGFEDPMYLIETNGRVVRKIQKTPYDPLVDKTDVSNLTAHVNGSYYIASPFAPSFLQRFEGIKTGDTEGNGIESLVNVEELVEKGIQPKAKTVVDYIYFSGDNPSAYQIQGMPSWFRIDEEHLDLYGVGNLKI